MIALGSYALLRPWWLAVLPLAAILLFASKRRRDLGDWPRAVDPPLLAVLLKRQGGGGAAAGGDAWALSVALLAIALSGPAVQDRDLGRFRSLDPTLILLDASDGAALQPGATAAELLLAQSGARDMGLILYAGDAYLAGPLTNDTAAVSALLFAVDDHTVPDGGARPERALGLARRVLRQNGALGGEVVLISHGAGLSAAATREALALAAEGHRLHSLFAAGSNGAPETGDRAQMASLAAVGGGLAGDALRPDGVIDTIANRGVGRVGQDVLQLLVWRDLGRFFLIGAALPLLSRFRRSAR